jgi:uncharacterized NAD(P)/FAD-binding protein YdhS
MSEHCSLVEIGSVFAVVVWWDQVLAVLTRQIHVKFSQLQRDGTLLVSTDSCSAVLVCLSEFERYLLW